MKHEANAKLRCNKLIQDNIDTYTANDLTLLLKDLEQHQIYVAINTESCLQIKTALPLVKLLMTALHCFRKMGQTVLLGDMGATIFCAWDLLSWNP